MAGLVSYLETMITTLRRYGIQPGDRIAALLPNGQKLIDLIWAAWDLGANICPLNGKLPEAQITRCLERLGPKLYVTESNWILRESIPGDVCSSLFLFTSGSTGTPKIAVLSQESLLANAEGVVRQLGLEAQDRWLLSLPLYHVGGIGVVLRCGIAGAKVVFDQADPEITFCSWVPTQLYRAYPVYRGLRCVLLGGAPVASIPRELPVWMSYGLTEMGSLVTARFQPQRVEGDLYLGHPLPGREVRIAEDGEVWVRGKCLFQGYWEKGQLHLPLQDGWFATGDLGHYCAKEGLAIRGRKDWQFISGGENIQPEELEQALLLCPEVVEAVVVPRVDPEFGFRPVAFVRAHTPFCLEKMRSQLLDVLPKYKIPIALHLLEEFPRIGVKVDRKKLITYDGVSCGEALLE